MNPIIHDDDFSLGFTIEHIDFDAFSTPEEIPEEIPEETTETINESSHGPRGGASPLFLQPPSDSKVEKPYHSKRPHKKSRAGCVNCKRRKVKCNEQRPTCQACTFRKEKCVYPAAPPIRAPTASSQDASPSSLSLSAVESVESNPFRLVVSEPLFRPTQVTDTLDMRMLWFWTAETYTSFSVESRRAPVFDAALKVKLVEYAFCSPFLMDCVMSLSATQMLILNQKVPPSRALAYRTRAFAGFRNAINAGDPADYPALIACSLLIAALSSQAFREADHKPLYIVDWIRVWHGIGLILHVVTPASLRDSGLAVMFYRPPVYLEKAAQYIPMNLLLMVASIAPGEVDHDYQEAYYKTLRYLGALYMELDRGLGPVLDLRAITFFTFVSQEFAYLAQSRRPRALIILAYYLCFIKLNNNTWWMQGISDPEIDHIYRIVGPEWAHLLSIPLKVRAATDQREIAGIIMDNPDWTGEDLYEQHVRGSTTYDFTLFNRSVGNYSLYSEEERSKFPQDALLYKMKEGRDVLPVRPPHRTTRVQDLTESSPQLRLQFSSSSTSNSSSTLSPKSTTAECNGPIDEHNWELIEDLTCRILGQNPDGSPLAENSTSPGCSQDIP